MRIPAPVILAFFFLFFIDAQAQAVTLEKEWTFLIFMNGNNSLDEIGLKNLKEMEKSGSTPDLNVVAQWASIKQSNTQRLYIEKTTDPAQVKSSVIETLPNVNMGDYRSLIDFIKWGVTNYPAKHYFINIWNHGTGWHFVQPDTLQTLDISYDDKNESSITTPQLGLVLNEAAKFIGHKVDIYGSDACLMAMPEVAYEMADSVSVYVGSEEAEPSEGWPYDRFLAAWAQNPKASAAQVAQFLTETFVSSYQDGSRPTAEVTFSSFNLEQINPLVESIKELGAQVRGLSSKAKGQLLPAIERTLSFSTSDYGDLVDFLDQIKSSNIQGISPASMTAVRAAVKSVVMTNGVTSEYAHAHGVSFWLPSTRNTLNRYWARYQNLKFEKQTSWGEALKAILK